MKKMKNQIELNNKNQSTSSSPSSEPSSEPSSSLNESIERSLTESDHQSSEVIEQDEDQDEEDQEDLEMDQDDDNDDNNQDENENDGENDDDDDDENSIQEDEDDDDDDDEEEEGERDEDEENDEDEGEEDGEGDDDEDDDHVEENQDKLSSNQKIHSHQNETSKNQNQEPQSSNHENVKNSNLDKIHENSPTDHSTTLELKSSNSNSYHHHKLERFKRVTKPRTFKKPPLIDPIIFIPHACPIHALSLPPCGSHLFSGGQDGFIRRFSIYDSVTGSSLENLTMKQGGHVPLVEKDTDKSTIFLTGYWENEDYNQNQLDDENFNQKKIPLKWGPKSVGNATLVSPVYSLAVHNEELWGLSGTESGNINLYTIRHDEGHIRHVFRASASNSSSNHANIKGHKPGSVISSLDLNSDQNFAFSGGWDGFVLGWDLNTGQVVNKFIAHASQISSVSLRQANGIPIYDSKFEENLMKRKEQEEEEEEEGNVPESERKVHLSEQVTQHELDKDEEMKDGDTMVVDDKNDKDEDHDDDDEEEGLTKMKAIAEEITQTQPPSSPEKPLSGHDKKEEESNKDNEEESEEDDGSLFGGNDNSESDINDSPDDSIPLASIGNQNKLPEKPIIPALILPTAAIIKPRLPLQFKKPELPSKNLTQVPSALNPSLPFLNDDVLMTSGIDGQVYLWDRRIGSHESSGGGFVRKLDVPKSASPWTASASWSVDGRSIYVGRRNESVDIYDLRFIKSSSNSDLKFNFLQKQHFQTSIKLPNSSGPVSSVLPWPDGLHLVCASFDNLRLYNLKQSIDPSSFKSNKLPFKIIPGHSSGVVSQMCVTPSCRFLITASGDRGWQNISNDLVVIHEIRNILH